MTPAQMRKLDTELREYIESMVEGMGRQERRQTMEWYLTGLLLRRGAQEHRADRGTIGTRNGRRLTPGVNPKARRLRDSSFAMDTEFRSPRNQE